MVERMWHLYQFPLCPFSRKVRFLMAEKGIIYELVRESPWEARDEFLDLNPAGMTPVLVADDSAATLVDSQAICEYFEETIEHFPLISGSTLARAEIRRLVAWFDQIVYRDVVAPLLNERMIKRIVSRASPDGGALRDAMRKANTHMDYMDYLLDHRSWLAGGTMTLADLAAAAHRSAISYLGDGPWKQDNAAKAWYARVKSRPSFRPLLSEWLAGVPASRTYVDLDF